jgi:hypothetical protein
MPIPPGFHHKTGKESLLASLNDYLVSNIDGGQVGGSVLAPGKHFFWEFDNPIAPLNLPCIATAEVGLFNLGDYAFDNNLLGFSPSGEPIHGVKNQTLVEINCWDSLERDPAATKNVRNLRDKVIFALTNAGKINDVTNLPILPPINLKAINEPGEPVVGRIVVDPTPNSINERFLIDPVNQQLRRIKLLVRIFWFELLENL